MALSLITPIGSNFINDWTSQNTTNCDRIDTYAGSNCLRTHAIGQYTPILSATTTAPTLGAGENKGFYYKIWDQIYAWGYFKFGTGFAIGSGFYTLSLPFPAKNSIGIFTSINLTPIVGSAYLWDESNLAARVIASIELRTADTMMFCQKMNSTALQVTESNPITWAVDDGIRWHIRYQRLSV